MFGSDVTPSRASESQVKVGFPKLHVHIPSFAHGEGTPSPRKWSSYPRTPIQLFNRPTERPPILAVVIGVNRYESSKACDDLTGAVADADAFEGYLKTHLNVPAENIRSLRDEHASRKAIISAFLWVRDHPAYKKDEAAVIIYFAGHGAQTDTHPEWADSNWITAAGEIGMLCPSDIGALADRERGVVGGITDRTISALLNQIADQKGNNITVILDCCKAAGMVRSTKRHNRCSNGTSRGRMAQQPLWKKHQSSYVVLAACGRNDFACEDPKTKRGVFTYRLLSVLENEDIDTLTYGSLMHKLSMPVWQTPHCEGDGIHWRLFNNRVSGADKCMVLTKQNSQNKETVLQAGSAQGVTMGSRFAAHATNLIDTTVQPNPCLGHFVVTHVDNFSSTLALLPSRPTLPTPIPFYSKLDQLANDSISLYSLNRAWLESIFPSSLRSELSVQLVDSPEYCNFELTLLNGLVYFDQYDPSVVRYIGSRMRYVVDVDDVEIIRNVVKSSLHFYRNLNRSSSHEIGGVRMELHKLSEKRTVEYGQVFTPVGQNLLAEEPAIMVVDEDAPLGITIHNDSHRYLYPYLFYFDPMTLTIDGWYLPPIGAGMHSQNSKVDAPLPPKSKLTIGHGEGGGDPWSFTLPPKVKRDLGFFRLFVSTRPASFEVILQEMPPFEGGPLRAPKRRLPLEEWSVKTFTLIQNDT